MAKVINQASGSNWSLYHGDCVPVMRGIPSNTIGMSLYSPPYSSLFCYSASERDMGNSRDDREFFAHFRFALTELFRVIKPGRIMAIDCMNLPSMKERDGVIGLKDFRGHIIRSCERKGFIFHSEHCIWKDPLIEATRTKSIGLMHKQLCKDSAMCRAGIPQYLLAFRKPGTNDDPIYHPHGLDQWVGDDAPKHGNLSHERWRRYASPVWMDINSNNTLNAIAAREDRDERHICPMSLDIIERAIWLWSKEKDIILSPYAGIGSEGHVAIKMGRRFIGVELKESYYREGVKNLKAAEAHQQSGLFNESVDEVKQ